MIFLNKSSNLRAIMMKMMKNFMMRKLTVERNITEEQLKKQTEVIYVLTHNARKYMVQRVA